MKIGDFARAGQVSVRMLRHYDQLGLLRPAHVDEWTGHRSYTPDQLERLDRIVALNQLGFTLDEVGGLLDDDLTGPAFADRLRERRAALAAEAHAVHRRLAEVARRLHHITGEESTVQEFVIKQLPPVRIAGLRGHAPSRADIGSLVGPLFQRVSRTLNAAGACPETGVASYEWADDGGVDVVVGYRYDGPAPAGLELVDLPAGEAATTVHLGPMVGIRATWEALDRYVGESGWAFDGPCREVYLEAGDGDPDDDQSTWVTELQQPVRRA